MAINDVAVVSVPVSDQQRAKEFYVDKLGFDLTRDDDSIPGIHWVQVTPKSGGTSLTLVNWFDTMAPGSVRGLVLRSTDIEADYSRLVAGGVEFTGPPERQPWGTETVLSDPDGNQLVLQQL